MHGIKANESSPRAKQHQGKETLVVVIVMAF